VNYRGAECFVPVDIWVQVDTFNVQYKDPAVAEAGYYTVRLSPTDNDKAAAAFAAGDYASQVTAEIALTSVREQTTVREVKYADGKNSDDTPYTSDSNWTEGANITRKEKAATSAVNGKPGTGRITELFMGGDYYSMNYGVTGDWGQVSDPTNEGKTKPVTFYYQAPQYSEQGTSGISKVAKNFKASLPVLWYGIQR